MPAQTVFLVAGSAAVFLTVAFAVVFSRLYRGTHGRRQVSPAKTPVRFGPMERLLREEDFAFLKTQRGFDARIAARLRARRVSIYRRYVSLLSTEFDRLHMTLRLLTLYAETDRAQTSRILVEQRLLFTYRLLQVQFRLVFFRFGVKPLDVTPLVTTIDAMRANIEQLSAPLAFQTTHA